MIRHRNVWQLESTGAFASAGEYSVLEMLRLPGDHVESLQMNARGSSFNLINPAFGLFLEAHLAILMDKSRWLPI